MSKKPQTKAPISASGEEINGVFVDEQADAAMEYDPASPAPSSKKGGKKNDFVETKQTGKPSQLSNTKQNPSDADIKPNNSKPSNTNTSKNDTRPQSGKQANKQAPIQEQASSKAVTTPGNQRVQSNNQQNGTTTNAGSQKVMATSPTEAKNALANQAAGARSKLVSAWSMKMPDGRSIDKVMQEKWDSWTPNVRQGFMKRVREAVTAGVQKTTARKEWDQWKTTLKFVLEDLFEKSRSIFPEKRFTETDGIKDMLIAIKDGKILTNEKETFYKRVDIMLADLVAKKDAPVPGFDIQDTKHRDTLFEIRDIYRIEWAVYVISKLSENSE